MPAASVPVAICCKSGPPLQHPYAVAVGPDGSLYIPNVCQVLKQSATSGRVSVFVGARSGKCADGSHVRDGTPASTTRIGSTMAVAVDQTSGDVYFAETWIGRVRKVDAKTGLVTTVAGSGQGGSLTGRLGDWGPATQAELYGISGLALSQDGHKLYISGRALQ